MAYGFLCVLCAVLAAVFISFEHKEKHVLGVTFKGLASLCFVVLGAIAFATAANAGFAKLVLIGLILGCVADVMLNLRFVFPRQGQKIFLVGIVIFLSGHVVYLAALLGKVALPWLWLAIGAVGTFFLIRWIFTKINAKKAFKIFGVFYLGAIMLMTCTALGTLITAFSLQAVLFAVGSVSFLVSDIVLILNTFGPETKFSLRITNLGFYYLGQLLIALSLLG